jgi:hypothetical protein
MSEADRERWMAARNSIRVTAAGWTAKNLKSFSHDSYAGGLRQPA